MPQRENCDKECRKSMERKKRVRVSLFKDEKGLKHFKEERNALRVRKDRETMKILNTSLDFYFDVPEAHRKLKIF